MPNQCILESNRCVIYNSFVSIHIKRLKIYRLRFDIITEN